MQSLFRHLCCYFFHLSHLPIHQADLFLVTMLCVVTHRDALRPNIHRERSDAERRNEEKNKIPTSRHAQAQARTRLSAIQAGPGTHPSQGQYCRKVEEPV